MKNRPTRIYLAGKVTGEPYVECMAKFNRYEQIVRKTIFAGYPVEVYNPMAFCNKNWSWLHCMLVCIPKVLHSDMVFMLPDWQKSKGARIERFIAKLVCKDIYL